jgi:L-amino acid N-acyltransferase YncA
MKILEKLNVVNMKDDIKIEPMLGKHWDIVSKIYKEGIETGFATFETEVPSWQHWDENHLKSCRLIATDGNNILGWAALSPVSSRCVYGGVAEVSVYVSKSAWGKQIGKKLLLSLINESEKNGIWTLLAGIFPENIGSIELHKKVGFRMIGSREKIGQLNGVWKDNILFERRSKIVGV